MSNHYGEYLNTRGGKQTPAPSNASGPTRINVTSTVSRIANDLLQFNRANSSAGNYTSNSVASNSTNGYAGGLSSIEAAILRSTVPIDIKETEEITVNGHRGIWANKAEVVNWRGAMPIERYEINSDNSPEIITKRTQQQLVYQQEVN
jgi:hypothetical protein